MAVTAKPFTFSAGAAIVSAQHNSNFDALFNLVNGTLDTTNLSASAAIVDTQLVQISTANKVATSSITGTLAGATLGVGEVLYQIGNGSDVILTGIQGDIQFPYACTLTQVDLLADASGSIVIDLWKDTYANYPPTIADTIVASAKPTISTATKSTNSTLTGWTTAVAADEIIRINVDSITTCTRVTMRLKFTRT